MMEQSGEPLLLVFPCSLPHTMQSLGHPLPALGRSSVRFHGVLLGHGPSLRRFRRRVSPALFGSFAGSMPVFDSSLACMPGLRFWLPGPIRCLDRPRMPARSLGSRACSFSTCVRLLDYAGPGENLRCRFRQYGLPVASTRSAPGIRFSKLDPSPVDASVYTSPGTSRHPAQDSRSRWFATPFLWGTLIPDCTPVYPDDCARSRSRLSNLRRIGAGVNRAATV